MIKFFRIIRQQLINQNKMGKYFKYAIGEIILVVIGILLALQINNWNEESKNRVKEREALEGIKTALESDLRLYEKVYQPRFDRKKQGLEFLKNAAYHKLTPPEDSVRKYFGRMGTDIFFRNDIGPYDALKSAGFELIKNKELRKQIINTYEVSLPAYTRFINDFTDHQLPLEQEFKKGLIQNYVAKKQDGTFDVWYRINVKSLLTNPSFLNLIAIEQNKYENYTNRMRSVKRIMNELIKEIDKKLEP